MAEPSDTKVPSGTVMANLTPEEMATSNRWPEVDVGASSTSQF